MDAGLVERLESAEEAFAAAEVEMASPEVAGDPGRYAEVAKRYADLRPVVTAFHALRAALAPQRSRPRPSVSNTTCG